MTFDDTLLKFNALLEQYATLETELKLQRKITDDIIEDLQVVDNITRLQKEKEEFIDAVCQILRDTLACFESCEGMLKLICNKMGIVFVSPETKEKGLYD